MNDYDLIIVGGGAGAFAAAIKANQLEVRTLLINKGLPLGGTCVNVGCVPSKNLLRAGEIWYLSQHHGFPGMKLAQQEFDFVTLIDQEIRLVEELRKLKYEQVLSELKNVTHIEGRAKFVSDKEIEVNPSTSSGRVERYSADKFIIAAGSTATVPPIEGIQEVGYLTHIEALQVKKQPKSLLIVGAGPVGLEFSQLYGHFGTKVTVLQKGPNILPKTEPEITTALAKYLKEEGIEVYTNVETKAARIEGEEKILTVTIDGQDREFRAQEILLAAGKTANTKDLDLEKAGVKIDEHQAIVVDETFHTSVPHIFAVGDVTNAALRIEPVAGREGTYAVENALRSGNKKINYFEVPWTVFTSPQVAAVGLTEADAKKMGIEAVAKTIPMEYVPKAQAIRDTRGLIKMVTFETKIIGVQILAPQAGDLIHEAALAVKLGLTIDDITDMIHVFPTLSEAIPTVALSFKGDVTKLSCCV